MGWSWNYKNQVASALSEDEKGKPLFVRMKVIKAISTTEMASYTDMINVSYPTAWLMFQIP